MPGGRPLKYKQPKKLQELIDKYFDECDRDKKHYTITGLAYALGTSRKTLCEYAKRKEFSNTIKAAKDRVEAYVEQILLDKGHAGAVFWMKNHDWRDKQVVDVNSLTDKSREELLSEINAMIDAKSKK